MEVVYTLGNLSRLDQVTSRIEKEVHQLKKAIVIGAVGLTIYLVLPSLDPPNAFLALFSNILPVVSAGSVITTVGAGAMATGSGLHLWRLKAAETTETTKQAKESKALATKFVPLDLLHEVKTMQREITTKFTGIQAQLVDGQALEAKIAELQASLSSLESEIARLKVPAVKAVKTVKAPTISGQDVTDIAGPEPAVSSEPPTFLDGLKKFA